MRWSLLLALLGVLSGCFTPVPSSKSLYVGEWCGPRSHLHITWEGSVFYERFSDLSSRSVGGRLKRFNGDSIEVGFGPIVSTVVVNKPPYLDGEDWKMVVEGMDLIRFDEGTGFIRRYCRPQ
jgi:hypothetical protein